MSTATTPAVLRWALIAGLGVGALALAQSARAHEGPEHEIEEITQHIASVGESADLLIERAIEYSVLGKNTEAIHDLERALRLDPGSLHAHRELGRLQFQSGRADEAITTVTRVLRLSVGEPIDRAGLLILRAEVLRSKNRLRSALEDCHAAIQLHPGNPEWYLLRSDLQRRLKMLRRRVDGIAEGLAQTGAGVLAIEHIEALLDAHRFGPALKLIEPELDSARIRGRWLVRRGRALLGLGRKSEGRADLRTGLMDMDATLDPARPDPTLLLDQAIGCLLLGDREGASRSLALAQEKGGDPAITERIQDLVNGAAPTSNPSDRARK